jgi:hypothetical protein
VRWLPRLLLAVGLAALPAGVAVLSCGTGAVGVDACRTIEEARCQLAPMCSPTMFDVGRCTRFYRDECLVGIQDTTITDNNALATDAQNCVAALNAIAACGAGDAGCAALDLVPDASCADGGYDPTSPCNVILYCPEVLGECSFVVQPADAGTATGTTTDAASG